MRFADPQAETTDIRALGDRAFLLDLPDLHSVLALADALRASSPAGVQDIVPAARTVAVLFDPQELTADAARTWLGRVVRGIGAGGIGAGGVVAGGAIHAATAADGTTAGVRAESAHPRGAHAEGEAESAEVTLDVVYDGEDLAEVAELAGLSPDELVRRHTSAGWRVAFGGFAPGFGYLVTDGDWPEVPRRSTPRTRVPAGAVGLAGAFSGAYPREGPGGWQLIGRTDAPLWRPRSSRPALLTPGTAVRFRAVQALGAEPGTATPVATDAAVSASSKPPVASGAAQADVSGPADMPVERAVTVLRAGPQLLVEDLGRPGWASIGAGRSGALDRGALRLANRLVGNGEGAAAVEIVVAASLRFEHEAWFAVTGARGELSLSARQVEPDTAVHARAGDVLELGPATHGLRFVVAVRGGVDATLELGSASVDVGAGLGEPLNDGDTLATGRAATGDIPAVDALTVWSPSDDEVGVHVVAGPRQDWFVPASVDAFYDTAWEVTAALNRVGLRLRSPEGVVLERAAGRMTAELPSEPMVPGAIQVPPSGEPTVLLADGPVTGGYPVIAVVADADLDLFAQLRPGQTVRFRHARRAR